MERPVIEAVHCLQKVGGGDPRGDAHLNDMVWPKQANECVELERSVDFDVRGAASEAVHPVQVSEESTLLLRLTQGVERSSLGNFRELRDPHRVRVPFSLHLRENLRDPVGTSRFPVCWNSKKWRSETFAFGDVPRGQCRFYRAKAWSLS